MLKRHYQQFLQANPGVQHYACHSHHYWPDVTRDATLEYWDDSAKMVDDKWDYFFESKVPALQKHIAKFLNTNQPEQLVFASNTHELLFRVMSALDLDDDIKIVSTDSEFHSFTRQVNRLDELSNVEVVRVASEPFSNFNERFMAAVEEHQPDLVFFSHVFFNSGVVVKDITQIISSISNQDTTIMVDGYHAFCALPIDLSEVKNRIFYLGGGYKYAQGGEGVCFMHCPKQVLLRPLYTGWFAEFGELQKFKSRKVDYSRNGFHYAGSTMDFTAFYRQLAVFEQWRQEGVTISDIHQHVQTLQSNFLDKLDKTNCRYLSSSMLVEDGLSQHGHFLAFSLTDNEEARKLHEFLKEHGIMTDYRGNRLRFGFAVYHEISDIDVSCLEGYQSE